MMRTGPSGLPPAAIERGRQIAENAPPMSDALMAELRLIIWGSSAVAFPAPPRPAAVDAVAVPQPRSRPRRSAAPAQVDAA